MLTIVQCAEEESSPVILQSTSREIEHIGGFEYYGKIARMVAHKASVPVIVHLDHGPDIKTVMQAIRNGFTSVMIDGSPLPFDENVALAKKVVDIAHPQNVTVEAMIGEVGQARYGVAAGVEGRMTDPREAVRFVRGTGVDLLAVSIGNVSGLWKEKVTLDLDRLRKISELLETPLALHGGTGVFPESLKKAIELGVSKVAIATALWQAFYQGTRMAMDRCQTYSDPITTYELTRKEMVKLVKDKMRLHGSSGRAGNFLQF